MQAMEKLTVAGYIGYGNSGDEVLLSLVLGRIRDEVPGAEVTVLSARPRETARRHGVRAIQRYDAGAILRELSRSSALIFCGGSLIQDVTSGRSLAYYLALLRAAERMRVKTMLFANGIGPLTARGGRAAADVLDGVDVITLRDEASARTLSHLGVRRPRIAVTADTAFLLPRGEARPRGGGRYAVISYRPWGGLTQRLTEQCCALAAHLREAHGIEPVMLPMQAREDMAICRAVAARERAAIADASAELFACAELTVGMRLHTLIYSAAAGTPAVGIAYDRKVSGLCRALGASFVGAEDDTGSLLRAVDAAVCEREELAYRARKTAREMAARAERTVFYLRELLSR